MTTLRPDSLILHPTAEVIPTRPSPRVARRRLPALPADVAQELRLLLQRARDGSGSDSVLLNAYVAQLFDAGWTRTRIGEAMGVTDEAVRQRCVRAKATGAVDSELPPVPPPPPSKPVRRRKPMLRPEFAAWLTVNYRLAKRCRGKHGPGTPERIASEQVWEAIHTAVTAGVPLADLAAAAGVETQTIDAGLRRHGYRTLPPSQRERAYQGARQKTHCARGHPLSGDNIRYVNGDPTRRRCRTCERIAARRYHARKMARRAA